LTGVRHLRPIDYIVEAYTIDLVLPESGFFADETMVPPLWQTGTMIETFFGRESSRRGEAAHWAKDLLEDRPVYFEGRPIEVPRFEGSDKRAWRLVDVERLARGLAAAGRLSVEQLIRVLAEIRIIAETWDYLTPSSIEYRIGDHDPARREVYAMDEDEDRLDDLDGAQGAQKRRFALGDQEYWIDLSDANWNDLVAMLAPFVKAAKRADETHSVYRPEIDRKAIREWARSQGLSVANSGRLPWTIINAYLTRKTG
jgi:hypothetical protein